MFGDDEFEDLIEKILGGYTFDEVLEENELTEEDVLRILIRGGHINVEEFDSKSIED